MRVNIDGSVLLKERSGVGQYVYRLVHGLGTVDSRNEYRLVCDSFRRANGRLPSFPYRNISYRRLPVETNVLKGASGLGRWSIPLFNTLFGTADVFHWPNYLLVPGGSCKHIITICDLTFLLFPAYHPSFRVRAYSSGIFRSAARADGIVVISEHTRRDVIKYLGVPKEKIRVVYCAAAPHFRPIPPSERSQVLSGYSLDDQKYVLFVGNIEPRKNLIRLLEAYSQLLRRSQYRGPLILAGGQGWRNIGILRCVEEFALEKHVRFLGYVPDDVMPALMSGAELFVYPSLYEGFGLPPLEAMACGTPVITSNVSSLPEVVGEAALTVNPHDVAALADAMHRVLTDSEFREEMRRKGLERANEFSWEETARQTLKVYEEIHAKGTLS
ncbi:MAG: glycosyltransferase family 1 protein [Nitrospiraceae bacterium]